MENDGYRYSERRGSAAAGRTVLDWLAERYRHSTREVWRGRIGEGRVLLDGLVALPDQLLRLGATLEWSRPPWIEPEVPLGFDAVHVDEHVVVVSKPSGLPTQPAGGYLRNTLQWLVQQRWPDAAPVHRLGRGTSGLVLFARTDEARRELSATFREGRAVKVYRTIVEGSPAWDELEIDVPIGPVPHPLLGTVHAASEVGRPSRSVARVVDRRAGGTVLDVRIFTGRPHQIRIHMAAVGHPLVGDPLYLPGGHPRPDVLPGDEGYALCARYLELPAAGDPAIRRAFRCTHQHCS